MDKMGVQSILFVKVSTNIVTILYLDGTADVTCKQTLTTVHKSMSLELEWGEGEYQARSKAYDLSFCKDKFCSGLH